MRRIGLIAVAAVVPALGIGALAPAMADASADRGVAALEELTRGYEARSAEPAPLVLEPLADDGDEPPPAPPSQVTTVAHAPRPLPKKGIRVRAAAVSSLADGGAAPSGAYVGPTARRPAGLVLSGVGALGVGLVDGDVLSHAAGQAVRSPGQVIGLVIGARAKRVTEIGGVFWRNGEPWQLIVEQPYGPSKPQTTPRRVGSVGARVRPSDEGRDGPLARSRTDGPVSVRSL